MLAGWLGWSALRRLGLGLVRAGLAAAGGDSEGWRTVAEQPGLGFAGLLRRLRAEAGLTQEELAETASLSPRSVSDLERGIHRTAHRDTAGLLADALGLAEPVRAMFVAAARGRRSATEVLAARQGQATGASVLPNNLPAQLSRFIGRDRELAEVRALVESSRLVTLTGAGGCGKTRLSLQVAAGLLDGSGEGVWLVELAAVLDEDAVAPRISEALRLAAAPGRLVLETLLDALTPQDVLIVLDNCEHLIGGCAKTADAIMRRCPRVRLLATSREPLGISGETIYRVPSLSLPAPDDSGCAAAGSSDAVALFADRATAQGVSLPLDEESAAVVVSVCRRLDGMPLAIELAAARLRSLALTELHDRLDQRFRLLTGGSRTALERQQTLRATVDWSYSLLTAAEQLLLQRLSVFAESFDLAAAEGVCGFDDIEVFEVAGLSVRWRTRASSWPSRPSRPSATGCWRPSACSPLSGWPRSADEAAAVTAAHCAHFLSVAEAAAAHLTGPDQGSWLARLHADQANLRRAAGYAASRPDGTALVLRLGVALDRYWRARSREQEAFGLLVPVLQRPDARADPALFGAALDTAARAAQFIDVPAARQLAGQAVEVARRLGDDRLLINSLATLCAAYFFAGEPEAGLPFGQESVERARSLGDDVLLGRSLMAYLTTFHTIDLARSLPLYTEAIACTERSGDHLINSFVRDGAGYAALEAGDIPAARAHVDAAVQAAQQIGWVGPAAEVTLGLVQRAEGDPDGARSTFEAGLRISRRNGDKLIMAEASLGLACLAGDAGDWDRAAALHGVAQAFIDRTGSPWQEFDARYCQDSLDQARAHLGDEQLERAYAQGMALSLEKALDLALPGAGPA